MLINSGARRFLSLWLPHWPTDQYRRHQQRKQSGQRPTSSASAEGPLVLSAQVGNRLEIQAVNPAARALGLKPGVAIADARAWVPHVVVVPLDPDADAADLKRFADWATRFSPLVATDGAIATLDALARGATDYVAKPANVGSVSAGMQSVSEQLLPKIKALSWSKVGALRPFDTAELRGHLSVAVPGPVAPRRQQHGYSDEIRRIP